METILREERFIAQVGIEAQVLRVQELVAGPERWPKPFRVQLPASRNKEAKTFYGTTAQDAVTNAAAYLRSSASAKN